MARAVNVVWNYCNEISDAVYKNHGFRKSYRILEDIPPRKKKMSYKEWQAKLASRKLLKKNYPDQEIKKEISYINGKSEKKTLTIVNGILSTFDLINMTASSSEMLGLPSATIQAICEEFSKAKKQKAVLIKTGSGKSKKSGKKTFKKNFISMRGAKSRPWVPFKKISIKESEDKKTLEISHVWDKEKGALVCNIHLDKRVIDGKVCDAKFIREHDGWYVSVSLDVSEYSYKGVHNSLPEQEMIGVDLGMKNFITTSNSVKINMQEEPKKRIWGIEGTYTELVDIFRSYGKKLENKRLAKLRALIPLKNKTKEQELEITRLSSKTKKELLISKNIKKLELNAKRWREDQHYKIAHQILDLGQTVVIGDLSGKFIQAVYGKKSKYLSLGYFKSRIKWLGTKRGQKVILTPEKYTTCTCSSCGEQTGPTGEKGLKEREWTCSSCGATHDRDENAAKNMILFYKKECKKLIEESDSEDVAS